MFSVSPQYVVYNVCVLLLLLLSMSSSSFSFYGTRDQFCNSTPYPTFCKRSFHYKKPGSIHDYTRESLRHTLTFSRRFLHVTRRFIHATSRYPTARISRALIDCRFLSNLNIDSLSQTLRSVNGTDDLQISRAMDLQTLLSATITNLETCLDGIKSVKAEEPSIRSSLWTLLSHGTKHCSVSLAFFTNGWIPLLQNPPELTDSHHLFSSDPFLSGRDGKLLRSSSTHQTPADLPCFGGVSVSDIVVVSRKQGTGNFSTVSDAVASAPNNTAGGNTYFLIYVTKGIYREYVSIPLNKQNVMMIGDGIGNTIITGNRSVVDGWTTFNSATFAVVGQGFVAVNMTFRNTAGALKRQAVAVRNGADMSAFYMCSFEAYQDTLYVHSLRQFYRDCEIHGTVDYIFGNAATIIQNSKIHSRLPLEDQFNTITAQGRSDPNQNTGIAIQNCSIKAGKELAWNNGTTKSFLGRPWKEFSRTVFMQSSISSFIDPAGWAPWLGDFALSTLYYAEFNNTGAGSGTADRVQWPGFRVINATDAANFTVTNFLQGNFWLDSTNVPYSAGLD